MKTEDLIQELFNEKDKKKQDEIFNSLVSEINNLDHIYVGLSSKRDTDDDNLRKPGIYMFQDRKCINIFTRYEYALAWANNYSRDIGLVEKGDNDFNLLYLMSYVFGVEGISINENSQDGICINLSAFVEINQLKKKYLFGVNPDIDEKGNLKFDFNPIEKLDLKTYKPINKEDLN